MKSLLAPLLAASTLLVAASLATAGDTVTGEECYHYGDNESLVQARNATKTLAVRAAVESYQVFIDAATTVTDGELTGDLAQSLARGAVKNVQITHKTEQGREICIAISGEIDPESVKEVLGNRPGSGGVNQQVNALLDTLLKEQQGKSIYVNPVVERTDRYASDFSSFLTLLIKNELAKRPANPVLGSKPVQARLGNTRGLKAKAREVNNLATSDAAYSGADAALEGFYAAREDGGVQVTALLKSATGELLASADMALDKSHVTLPLDNPQAQQMAVIADVAHQMGGETVAISTNKGGLQPVFVAGEKVRFRIQVAKPLYLYIYDINAQQEVSLLYPYEGDPPTLLPPNRLFTIPGETDDWEIAVEPPFGTDTVKVFASETPLTLPAMDSRVASQSFQGGTRSLKRKEKSAPATPVHGSINPLDLVDYFRGEAQRQASGLYETSLFLETRAR